MQRRCVPTAAERGDERDGRDQLILLDGQRGLLTDQMRFPNLTSCDRGLPAYPPSPESEMVGKYAPMATPINALACCI